MWKTVNNLLQPLSQSATDNLSADDFAKFFVDKVAKIRASTAAAAAPVIIPRDVLPLTELEPTSVHEIIKVLSTMPAKSCSLDPIPTWLLKRISATIHPVLCHLCKLSFQRGIFTSQLKHVQVTPCLKKPTLDPDISSSTSSMDHGCARSSASRRSHMRVLPPERRARLHPHHG